MGTLRSLSKCHSYLTPFFLSYPRAHSAPSFDVASMQRSGIKEIVVYPTTSPGFRFTSSGLPCLGIDS